MSKLTPFGAELRKLRIDRELRLFDLAEKVGRSTAMLSAIETGRKAIPDRFVADLVKALVLTPAEHKALREAKDKTIKEVSVEHLSPDDRHLIAAFARNREEIPEKLLQEIRKVVLKSSNGDTPFQRKPGILVSAMSSAAIEDLAGRVRNLFGCVNKEAFPIVEVIEFGLMRLVPEFVFDIWERDEMGGDEGRVIAGKNTLILRRDVYESACRGEGAARFTAAHELGHYIMHHDISFARARAPGEPIYRDAEWQADSFAGNLMMPRDLVARYGRSAQVSLAFKTSEPAARYMLQKYQK